MTIEELEQWQEEFEQFHERFADLFERSESREQAKKYLRGLLAQAERKNSWQVAEAVGDRIPDRMQRLLYRVSLGCRGGARPSPAVCDRDLW